MQKFEYFIQPYFQKDILNKDFGDLLNHHGNQGWEIIKMLKLDSNLNSDGDLLIFFKREIQIQNEKTIAGWQPAAYLPGRMGAG